MDYNSLSLKMHEEHKGKVEVVSKVAVKNRDDLSTAYTPGVAEPCRKIRDNKADVYKYTCKGQHGCCGIRWNSGSRPWRYRA